MIPKIYWITDFKYGRLGTMARPRGGEWLEDEIIGLKSLGVQVVASALTDNEMNELDISAEYIFCKKHGIRLCRYPVFDRGVPSSMKDWAIHVQALKTCIEKGQPVVTHCRMGIGRASMIAASLMVSFNISVDQAFEAITKARGLNVPDTAIQVEWVSKFADGVVNG